MRIIQLTPGAGGMFCGGCLRDNALVKAWRAQGHEALMAPLYLPPRLDESPATPGLPIFFGGINVYLQQKASIFRKLPKWMDKAFDANPLLKLAAKFTGRTRPDDLGQITISMLKGEEGRQAKELEHLIAWLRDQEKPDIVSLSSVLLAGLARRIKEALGVPVTCGYQGEHLFLDALPPAYREDAWRVLRERAADIDLHIAPSRFYADMMHDRTGIPLSRLRVVHNGINLDGFGPAPAPPAKPVLGFFARLGPEKGLPTVVEAFVLLKRRNGLQDLQFHAGGGLSPNDRKGLDRIREEMDKLGFGNDVRFFPNLTRDEKQAFLRDLSVFSVPATYGEPFGLYLLEAWGSGIPVVQPRHGAYPELIEATQGGLLCEPNNAKALADALEPLLRDPARARAMGETGRQAVLAHFSADRMAREMIEVMEETIARQGTVCV